MTPALWTLVFFALVKLCLICAAAINGKAPRIALAFEAAAFGCLLGMVQSTAVLNGFLNGG